jgi:hypothetical protein
LSEAAAVFSAGVLVLASAGGSDESGLEAFGACESCEVEASPEADGSSAWAIPLLKPTATQADSTRAATVSRNHQ